jgi:AcrR family transcriptional regulator
MQTFTISQLEKATGMGRDTIYYYIREGLLPAGQKASATRSIYTESHADFLREIGRLKAGGLSLSEIRGRLGARFEKAAGSGVDLVARQNEDSRNAILQVAARRFAKQGYERTRIADVCKAAGVTAQVLYRHFPSKRHLFIACYQVYFEWMSAQAQPAIDQTDDLNARLAWRAWASYGIQSFSPDLLGLARVEAVHPESELRGPIRELFSAIFDPTVRELAAERRVEADPGLLDEELVSYAFEGALGSMQMRASWDDRYDKRDVIRNLLVMFMAARAAYSGRLRLTQEWEAVAGLVDRLAASGPHTPEDAGG